MDKKRKRGDNWVQEEKDLLLQIMSDSAAIIENKKTDTNTNKQKQLEWINVQRKFCELSGKRREVAQLKGAWRRLRMTAKKRVGEHKRVLNTTGGGQKPLSPTDEDRKIMDICPTDFIIEENVFDSDGFFKTNLEDSKKQKEEKTVQKICDDEDSVEHIERPAVMEEVFINEINDEEVSISTTPYTFRSDNDTRARKLPPKRLIDNIAQKQGMPQKGESKKRKAELSQKANILQTNIEVKERALKLLEEEYKLKIMYQTKELCHQDLRHKLETEVLMIEKEIKKKMLEKKELEILLLKSQIS